MTSLAPAYRDLSGSTLYVTLLAGLGASPDDVIGTGSVELTSAVVKAPVALSVLLANNGVESGTLDIECRYAPFQGRA